MKRALSVALLITLISSVTLSATRDWQTGNLVDVQRTGTGAGAARAQGAFCIAVAVGDVSYLSRYEPHWRWAYEPTDLVVGDSLHVRLDGSHLYIQKQDGGELKTEITRRQRVTADTKPVNCGLPISARD
jgi:hypothetical protein